MGCDAGRFCPSGTQQLAVLADAVERGGAEGVDVVVVDIHGEGREVADAAFLKGLGCDATRKNVFGMSAGMLAAG